MPLIDHLRKRFTIRDSIASSSVASGFRGFVLLYYCQMYNNEKILGKCGDIRRRH